MLTNHFIDEEGDINYVYNNTIVLSRYLYSIADVKQSLFLSILEHNTEQALFWGYELYFSGFQEETFDYLMNIARTVFQLELFDCDEDNDMIYWVDYCKFVWNLSPNESHHQIGSCIITMCNHDHNLVPFIDKYFHINVEKIDWLEKNAYINMKPKEVEKYNEDYSKKDIKLYKVLQHARKYAVNKTYNKLFETYRPEKPEEVYFDNWLYHASISPVWEERIAEYGGKVDEENNKIVFRNEDLEEEFYEKWNYEPDEQSLETHQKAMGNPDEKQKDLEWFCLQYGYRIQ